MWADMYVIPRITQAIRCTSPVSLRAYLATRIRYHHSLHSSVMTEYVSLAVHEAY